MAFIRLESGFKADAQPPRKRFFWLFPGPRPSSAYGYAQALNSTWYEYQKATGRWWVERDDFADAIDFVGWYNQISYRRNDIPLTDAYHLYLAYHEGQHGYRQQTYQDKRWLLRTARRAANKATQYEQQLQNCTAIQTPLDDDIESAASRPSA